MNIDWFTFAAQIINFLILVALLRYFLYRPVVDAMQRREHRIAASWTEAEQKIEEAEQSATCYAEKTAELDSKREELIQHATRDAQAHQARLTRDAREEVQQQRQRWMDELEREQIEAANDLRFQIGDMAFHAARHTLTELADTELQDKMVDRFIEQLVESEKHECGLAGQLGVEPQGDARILSAFDLSAAAQQRLRQTVRDSFGIQGEVHFARSNELLCGIRLELEGYRFDWDVNSYLDQLQVSLSQSLQRNQ